MPYTKSPRPYKHEYQMQLRRGEHEGRMERQRARRKMDKEGRDANKDGRADKREGKDIAHKKHISKGGKNSDGVSVQSRSRNRSNNRQNEKKKSTKKKRR